MLRLIYQRHTKFNKPPGDGHITQEGREILDTMADTLIAKDMRPDRIDVSPVTRGVESAEEEIIHFREGGHIIEGPRVVPELEDRHTPGDFYRAVRETPARVKKLLCLSHDHPILTNSKEMASTKELKRKVPVELPHAAAIVLEFNTDDWKKIGPNTATNVECIVPPGA